MVDQAYDAIRNYIIEHGLGIGDVLPPENTFSKQLGVSRNILREALGRYRILGILESRQKVGSVIIRLFPDDPYRCFFPFLERQGPVMHAKLAEFRSCLETGAAIAMVRNVTDEDLARLEEILQPLKATKDLQLRHKLEVRFHETLLRSAHNDFINSLIPLAISFLSNRSLITGKLYTQKRYMKMLGDSHQRIFDALKARKLKALQRELMTHTGNYLYTLPEIK